MKKGVSLIVLVITIIVMVILAGVAVMNMSNVFEGKNVSILKSDISQIEALMSIYKTRRSGFIDFDEIEFNTSSLSVDELEQFEGERITNNKIQLYIVDLNKIDAEGVNYGNLENGANDRYLYSDVTGKVYYEKGLTEGGNTYYYVLRSEG